MYRTEGNEEVAKIDDKNSLIIKLKEFLDGEGRQEAWGKSTYFFGLDIHQKSELGNCWAMLAYKSETAIIVGSKSVVL